MSKYQAGPAAKGIFVVIIIAALAAVGWNFFLKERFAKKDAEQAQMANAVSGTSNAGAYSGRAAAVPSVPANPNAALGTPGNPLKVSLVSFHGYAPGLLANGNSLKTAAGSIYARLGLSVEFVINDDMPAMTTLFESKAAQCVWRTSDFWAQEQPNLRNSGHDAKAVMLVDNTRGGDAIITRDPSIKRVEDLAGKSVALVQFTPSHGMLIDAIENSSMTARAKQQVKMVFIKPEEGTPGVRSAIVGGQVDAAVLWDPDLSLAIRDAKANVIYSTKAASNLIFDLMACDQRELNKPQNTDVFQKFVDGWMEGVEEAKANPDRAVDALVSTEEFFRVLASKEGKPFVKGLFSNLLWTGLSDNARILGLAGDTNHYERVYTRFDQIYRAAGALANPKSPVISAQESFDYRFIKAALARDTRAKEAAARPAQTYTEQGRTEAMAAPAQVTKPVAVSFPSGAHELSKKAQQVIDKEMVPFIENNGSAYFELSGNSDSVGSDAANLVLSNQRAKAVAEYLEKQWEIPRARLKVVGYGSSRPLCDEGNPAGAGMSLDECRSLNRSTRLAVFGR
ncbi:flagellar motor protein MotB [Verminephrobacter aporrectodeae subsp. tuberculatae]|uniref:Flagellar motor protein MotB n=1 Tax=Verminephrobacter aporrectodeae subsp. tuberculatae TaxID=1110392 RepID=A0ABT3KTJ8_9BURK|nr:phosphate ABC transporter substrate-binding/OmpA family protein [Verminephrobacter aporrectodeae]MCW5256084.1 flagellar motor protein MotB [Verminephrobacter aporrectodeae subsp. tuberculatae]MCW5321125.1 flagellar motor protein MotB [Verminephrobacter aporrectodeae subsp. tuberculatae]